MSSFLSLLEEAVLQLEEHAVYKDNASLVMGRKGAASVEYQTIWFGRPKREKKRQLPAYNGSPPPTITDKVLIYSCIVCYTVSLNRVAALLE